MEIVFDKYGKELHKKFCEMSKSHPNKQLTFDKFRNITTVLTHQRTLP